MSGDREGTPGPDGMPPTEPLQTRGSVLRFGVLREGALFAGRYEIRQVMGAGGAGEVYRALDRIAGIDVALKVLFPGGGDRDVERLRRELRIVRSLQHPGILRVHDVGESDGLLFTVSELLEGESLASRLEREGRLEPPLAERILRGMLEALAVAHAAGVVHRDVKPANVFLARTDDTGGVRVVLLDFGLARDVSGPALTTTGRFVGTPEYCSPEQIRGEKRLAPASDLYSCGVTFWRMLSGKPPFEGDSDLHVMTAHVRTSPPSPRKAMRGAAPRLRAFALRLLEKSPSRRPADAARALALLDRRGLAAWVGRGSLELRRMVLGGSGRLAAAIGVGLLALVAAAAWLLWPMAIGAAGSRAQVRTRSGWRVESAPVEGEVVSAVAVPGASRWTDGIWVAERPQDARRPLPSAGRRGRAYLFRFGLLDRELRPVLDEEVQRRLFETSFFPFESPSLYAAALIAPPARPGWPEDAAYLLAHHSVDHPCLVALIEPGGKSPVLPIYFHPGHLSNGLPIETADGERLLVVNGINNQIGPRAVVAALHADSAEAGQGPPYIGSIKAPDTARYYLPLPYASAFETPLVVAGRVATLRIDERLAYRFDAERGIPLDADHRGGLSPDAWNARRDALFEALFDASNREQTGEPAAGAAALERFAAEGGGSSEILSIPLYRASQLRMTAVAHGGGAAELERARADIERALSLEPMPPRYGLLHADILARLGLRPEAHAALIAWWGQRSVSWLAYDWLLTSWLAGANPTVGRVRDAWGVGESPWGRLVDVVWAHRRGEYDRVVRRLERSGSSDDSWNQHLYWGVRACLDRSDPDPDAALALLDRAERSWETGIPLPLRIARIRAHLIPSPSRRPAPEDLRAAADEGDALVEAAASKIDALLLLRMAREDLRWIAERLGDPAELRAVARRADLVLAPRGSGSEAFLPWRESTDPADR